MKKAWFRTSLVVLSLALVGLAACARERSGDVHEGAGNADALKLVMHDDEFEPGDLRLEAGTEVQVEVRNEAVRVTTSRSTRWTCRPGPSSPATWSPPSSRCRTAPPGTTARSTRA